MVRAIHRYFANQIIKDEIEYSLVVSRRADLKEGIDEYLKEQNYQNKIQS